MAALGWALLITAVLLTALLAGWVLLAAVLLGGGQMSVVAILAVLLAISIGLAWLVSRYIASLRSVGLVIAGMLALLFIVGATWALSSPDKVVFLARDLAWPGGDVLEYQKYPQRAISNAPTAFHFRQNLSPQLFQTIEYKQGGRSRQAGFDEFLLSSHTTAFLVIKDGAIVYEGYSNGYTRDSIVTSFSIAKSFTSALIGIAIDEGYINSVDDPIINYLPELRGKGFDTITIRHLLTMSTGIRFVSKDEQPLLVGMLPFNDLAWTTNYPDLRRQALSVKPDDKTPEEGFKYNDYYPQLLGMILERTTHRPVAEYLQEKLWQPLGMEYAASWSLDGNESGFEHMESGINARAVDFAKFGQLFLDNGNWNGKQIISKRWVKESTAPDPNDHRPFAPTFAADWRAAGGYYKYMWWGILKPDGSYDYMARGGGFQLIAVSPQTRVIMVRFGFDAGSVDSWPDIFEQVIAKVK